MGRSYNKDINLFNKVKRSNKNYVITVALTIHVLLGVLVLTTFFVLESQRREYLNLLNKFNNMSTQEELFRIQENKDSLNNLIARSRTYEDIINLYNQQNFFNVYLMDIILGLRPSDIVINNFTYRNRVFFIQASSLGIREGADYAERLLLSGYFDNVIYSGVATQVTETGYSYNIILYIGDDNIEVIE